MRDVKQSACDMSRYRLQRADEDLASAKRNLKDADFRTAINRSYYAIFHALRSVLALDEFDSKKHSGIISEFRKRYVKTGLFDVSISDMIGDAFKIRNESDYSDMYIVSKEETYRQVENADIVISAIRDYLKSEGIE